MKTTTRYALCMLAGIAAGLGLAGYVVKTAALKSGVSAGPWRSGGDFGSAEAGALTRAVIAVHGTLALPATEARYYTAYNDDAGQPLDGRCSYRLKGGDFAARWWTMTLYDTAGYLVANEANVYSLRSAQLPTGGWNAVVAPARQDGAWLPTGGIERFSLTLRTYMPADGGRGNLTREQLPSIEPAGCA